jgi:putative transposase
VILGAQRALTADGISILMSQLCRWFEATRRSVYYKPCQAAPKVQVRVEKPSKVMIERDTSFGYRTVTGLLSLNKKSEACLF